MNDYLDPVQPHRDALALMTAARTDDREGVLAILGGVPSSGTVLLLQALAEHGAAAFEADPTEGWEPFATERRVVFARAEAVMQQLADQQRAQQDDDGEPDPEPGRG